MKENGIYFVLHDAVTEQRMEKIKNHPHAAKYFRFDKFKAGLWNWYVMSGNMGK